MKGTLLIGFVLTASLAALAQGKVNVINDAASLILLTTDTDLVHPADRGLAGQPIGNQVPLPSGTVLEVGLYAGTGSSALYYYPPVTPPQAFLNNPSAAAGVINAFQVVLSANPSTGTPAIPGIANGTAIGANTPWFQVRVWDSAYASFYAALANGAIVGQGPLFQMNPGPSLASQNTAPPGVNSTWSETPIYIGLFVPEPSTTALVGLGVATLLIFRRRK